MSLGVLFFPSDSLRAGVSPLRSNSEGDIYSTHGPIFPVSITHALTCTCGKGVNKTSPPAWPIAWPPMEWPWCWVLVWGTPRCHGPSCCSLALQ